MAYEKISASRLSTPLNKEPPENDPDVEAAVIESIYGLVKEAKGDVAILIDACTIRHRIKEELREFLDKTQFPVYAAPMGKTAIDEDYSRYGGVCFRLPDHHGGGLSPFFSRFTLDPLVILISFKRLKAQRRSSPLDRCSATSTPETSRITFLRVKLLRCRDNTLSHVAVR